jgi:hypothetical protein
MKDYRRRYLMNTGMILIHESTTYNILWYFINTDDSSVVINLFAKEKKEFF